jgi:NADPH2:quinone reductase
MRTRAARLKSHGAPLEIDEIDPGEPEEGQCLVEMAFGGVNPVDRYQAIGRINQGLPLPRTLGSEGSGVVREDGRDHRVFVGRAALVRESDGVWASHLLVARDKLIDIPEAVSLEVAAAMGIAGVTAWRCVTELADVVAEDRVLVLGASGGVGSVIVSLAHHLGAEVVAQTGSSEKAEFTLELGADEAVVADADDLVSSLGKFRPTVVFDPLGGAFTGAGIEVLEERGRLVLFGTSADPSGTLPLQSLYRKALRVLGYAGLIENEGALAKATAEALAAVAEEKMEIVLGPVVPLEEVNTAFQNLTERRVRGNQVLALR